MAALSNPVGVAVDTAGNLYIVDQGNQCIRKVSATGTISTIAGNGQAGLTGDGGPATSASLNGPISVTVDAGGNVYIADSSNYRVRKVNTAGIITTVAGNGNKNFSGDGGSATNASFRETEGVTVDAAGNLYFSDTYNYRIREVLTAPISGLQASPSTLSFSATAGGAAPGAQASNLSSSIPGLSFAASSSASWLSVTPASGSLPASLEISADPSQLAAGTYNGTVTITAAGAVQTASVTFNVGTATPGKLGVSSPTVAFSITQGSASTNTQLSVSNQGGGGIDFTAIASTSTGGAWLQVSPASGTATPASAVSLTVTATPGNLGGGTYSGSIMVNSATTGESISVPVTMSISAAQQKILLSQTGLTFIAVEQGGAPLPQDFGILNTGNGSMGWSAKASTLSGGSWLSIDQQSGTVATPFTDVSLVNVSVDPSGLKAGNYYGQIQVTSSGAANSPQSISVVVNVLPAGNNPGPEVRPTGLIFIGTPGNTPGSQNVTVSNPQGSPITFGGNFFTVPTGGNWAQFVPANATVQPNAPTQVIVQPDYTSLASGVYQGFVSLGFLDGSCLRSWSRHWTPAAVLTRSQDELMLLRDTVGSRGRGVPAFGRPLRPGNTYHSGRISPKCFGSEYRAACISSTAIRSGFMGIRRPVPPLVFALPTVTAPPAKSIRSHFRPAISPARIPVVSALCRNEYSMGFRFRRTIAGRGREQPPFLLGAQRAVVFFELTDVRPGD
jgi:BACON domain-containing protein/NHL repeat-containing protein